MAYRITQRQRQNAKNLSVTIKPSLNPKKKLDVFSKGKKIAEIGASGYMDYDLYLKTQSKSFADNRRRLYKIRHQANRNVKGSNGYYADKILW